jgi:hypothetical protein
MMEVEIGNSSIRMYVNATGTMLAAEHESITQERTRQATNRDVS